MLTGRMTIPESSLLLGTLAYLCYAASSGIDKSVMNSGCGVLAYSSRKMLLNGLLLASAGSFWGLSLTGKLVLGSLVLGFLYALGEVLYYRVLASGQAGAVIPCLQSLEILLIFFSSIALFGEPAGASSLAGILAIMGGVYLILSRGKAVAPRHSRALLPVFLAVAVNLLYSMSAKKLLFEARPLDLAVAMYLSTALILAGCHIVTWRNGPAGPGLSKSVYPRVFFSSLFGASGTLCLFGALTTGLASRVFPLAGLQSVFVTIIAAFFLKEQMGWPRAAGVFLVFLGVFLLNR